MFHQVVHVCSLLLQVNIFLFVILVVLSESGYTQGFQLPPANRVASRSRWQIAPPIHETRVVRLPMTALPFAKALRNLPRLLQPFLIPGTFRGLRHSPLSLHAGKPLTAAPSRSWTLRALPPLRIRNARASSCCKASNKDL